MSQPRSTDPIIRDDSRYRIDNGEAILDVRVTTADHLFDNRDLHRPSARSGSGLVEYWSRPATTSAPPSGIRLCSG